MSVQSVMPSNYLILCLPPLLLPPIPPSIRVFSNESVLLIRWPKYWNFSFSISPSNEYSGPVSFRTDWFDLLEVQGTLESLLQHLSSTASILRCSVFFMVQLAHPWNNKLVPNRKRSMSGCILSPCLFNLYAEHITRNTGLEEAQAGIKISRRNINSLKYADDTTLTAESKEELKKLLRRVKKLA